MILMAFGTRPEYIKIKPLINKMQGRIPFKLLFTGQHVDLLANVKDQEVISLDIKDGSESSGLYCFFDHESGSHL